MRIVVTLDPDVDRLLKDEAHRRGESFNVVLNDVVRKAFRAKSQATARREPFAVKARPMGIRHGVEPARVIELADEIEINAFLNTTKRLQEKKQ